MTKYWKTPVGVTENLHDILLKEDNLLIAGYAGSGKSVLLNGIISRLLYTPPTESKFVLVDLKLTELYQYSRLPHTIAYCDNIPDTIAALENLINTIFSRNAIMRKNGWKKWDGPKIYLLIDEIADLFTVDKKSMLLIQRILQIGRASGIKTIACTQCVKSEIIPTRISCNFSGRVALRTINGSQSRLIIDTAGAEKLPRYGQCILYNPDGYTKYYVHMIPEEEINRLINHWLKQTKPKSCFSWLFG